MSKATSTTMKRAHAAKPATAKAMTLEAPKVGHAAGKQRLNVTVRADLIARARAAKLNLSSVIEESLELTLRKAEAARWAEENAEAIAYHNARIEREGLWHKGLTPWY